MTTREFMPKLDRQISRQMTTMVEVPGTKTYSYNTEYTSGGNTDLDAGTWVRISDTLLAIGVNDSNGLPFPEELEIPASGVEVAWDGATATILTITDLTVMRHGFTFQAISIHLTFDGTLPAAGIALTLGIDTGESTTVEQIIEVPVWAGRRDFSGGTSPGGTSPRWSRAALSRSATPGMSCGPKAVPGLLGTPVSTRTARRWWCRGVQQIGRGYLELLARFWRAVAVYACPRLACGGSVGVTWYETCSLCARAPTGPRPPTAEEKRSRGRGMEQPVDYWKGIYDPDLTETELRAYRAW